MRRNVESSIGCKQPVHELRVVLPFLNLMLECFKLTALQIELQQTTWHQVKQTWGLNWGPQSRLGGVHFDGGTRATCSLHVESLPILA